MGVRRTRSWRALLAAVATVSMLLLPASPGLATPGSTPGQGQPGQGQQGQGQPGQGQPGKPGDGPAGPGAEQAPEPAVWTGVPGTNLAHDSYGYAWPAAPDCDESDVGTGGCVNDGRGFFQGQCTSWVAHRVSQRNGISFTNWYDGVHWGNAVDWKKVARGLEYRADEVPAVGAIGWYARGHVSYVEDVHSDGTVVISEMNTDGHNGFHVVTVTPGGAGWPDKFIHVSDVVPLDYTAPERPQPVKATRLDRGVSLTWQVPADDIGVTGYRVLRNGMPLAEPASPAYVDRQASRGQNYTYSVVAHDAAGNISEAAVAVVSQTEHLPARRLGRFLDATEVSGLSTTVTCGRLGSRRDQRVGCRVRTLDGWTTVRTGREVPWGRAGTRSFLATDTEIWFCRVLPGSRNGCLPLDLTTLSWGFDRVKTADWQPDFPVWVATAHGPARCGVAGDRAGCTVLRDAGWKGPRRAVDALPGDPLSRAFVPVERGVAFCRNVEGRPTCTTLDTKQLEWTRSVRKGHDVPHGRWVSRTTGPALCPVGGGDCRVVSAPGAAAGPARSR